MLLILTPSCKWLREKGIFGRKADTMAVWMARQDSLRVTDSIRKVQDRLMAFENARLDSLRMINEEMNSWNSKYRYNIIVGSFITPEYARKYSDRFASEGYKTRILKLEGTQFEMVSAEAHESFYKARERLKLFQDTVVIDAWMYIVPK